MAARGVHATRVLVLLPYAHLVPLANRLWARTQPDGFAPRFETTRTWARQLAPYVPATGDLTFDAARDVLVARDLLERAGLGHESDALVGRVVESAMQLAAPVAALPPSDRADWARRAQAALSDQAPVLAYEQAVARIAAAWAATSTYATDVWFTPQADESFDALLILEGVQREPLSQALVKRWPDRVEQLSLPSGAEHGALYFHVARDGEDEAERAAACVLTHLGAGRVPVALAATDRALVRRVRALLGSRGVAIRDETGWRLSTTLVAARLMGALRACTWNASSDAVLDWAKTAPAWRNLPLRTFESWLRREGWRDWRAVNRWFAMGGADGSEEGEALLVVQEEVARVRKMFDGARTLARWLTALRELLQCCGLYQPMKEDDAGTRVLAALRLEEGALGELESLRAAGRRMTLTEFISWVDTVLEAASYVPPYPAQEQVTILPMSQMLARSFAALVLPGCDELRMPAAPEPPGAWTSSQRMVLGLPDRDELTMAYRTAWHVALGTPWCDLLWRTGDDHGEPLLASPLVQALQLDDDGVAAEDAREIREVAECPMDPPQARGAGLLLSTLSASAYADLRACPYRFFAMRMLGLKESEELETEIGKRDFGLWLHAVLRQFHVQLQRQDLPERRDRVDLINRTAEEVTRERGLDEGEFLPFAASWPAVREGYLDWLASYEAEGGQFLQAESWQETPLPPWRLIGQIDRIDRAGDGRMLVIDYKTEPRQRTAERVRDAVEDTQLAFYAALQRGGDLRAAYLNIGERDGVKLFEQLDVMSLRDRLLESILHDLGRIEAGTVLPALGEDPACTQCSARGLCRKDFWAGGLDGARLS